MVFDISGHYEAGVRAMLLVMDQRCAPNRETCSDAGSAVMVFQSSHARIARSEDGRRRAVANDWGTECF
ncbi:hypothetical protein C1H84_12025 [Glutamicibacter soli]|uniref:Uncharacterized protein n=1 Tax=Glutamicibacter soli TaxID=453836 RepID=A0A365YE35_9MICC|nr:hypothetical protein C1H84_12025 [Glutamicibacter soli]